MALTSRIHSKRTFMFQNSNSKFYRVMLDENDGTGDAILLGDNPHNTIHVRELPKTALVFTPANVKDKHDSYLSHAAIFGAGDDTALNAILNAA